MTTLTGQVLGRYRLQASLGKGGMAEVYRAEDGRLGRTVAVKVILPTLASDPQFRQRFLREARLIAGLEHPNILPVYDFGEEGEFPYLVMPCLEGGTLDKRLDRQGAPLPQAVEWVHQLASALDTAHEAGILHRDVKPSNVLLGSEERLILGDFGIAKMTEASTRLTLTGVMVGTPLYMAPELVKGEPASKATDLYALAALAFQMLAGRTPYQGDNVFSLLHQHVNDAIPSMLDLRADLPSELDSVFVSALAKDPKERPTSCRAFAASLGSQVAGEESSAGLGTRDTQAVSEAPTLAVLPSTPSPVSPSTVPGPPPTLPPDEGLAERSGPPRRRWSYVAVPLLAVAIAVPLLLTLGTSSSNAPPDPPPVVQPEEAEELARAERAEADPRDAGGASLESGALEREETSTSSSGSGPQPQPSGGESVDGGGAEPEEEAAPPETTAPAVRVAAGRPIPEPQPGTDPDSEAAAAAGPDPPPRETGLEDEEALSPLTPEPGPGRAPPRPFRSRPDRDRGRGPNTPLTPRQLQVLAQIEGAWRRGRPSRTDYEKLLTQVNRELQKTPDSTLFLFLKTFANGGLAYIDGREAEAAKQLTEMLQESNLALDLLSPLPIRFIGRRRQEVNDWQLALAYGDPKVKARQLLQEELRRDPSAPSALLGQAVLYHLEGEHLKGAQQAQSVYGNLQSAATARSDVAHLVGEEYAHAGRIDSAIFWYQRVRLPRLFQARSMVRTLEIYGGMEAVKEACDRGFGPACRSPQRPDAQP